MFWSVSINQSINIKTSPWDLTALQGNLQKQHYGVTLRKHAKLTMGWMLENRPEDWNKGSLWLYWCFLPAAGWFHPAADDFCHNWSIALSPYTLLPKALFKANAMHPSLQMNCWWVQHLQTIYVFLFAAGSIFPPPISLCCSSIPISCQSHPVSPAAFSLAFCTQRTQPHAHKESVLIQTCRIHWCAITNQ